MTQGEGSRGGKIIGHTKSGAPIYDGHRDKAIVSKSIAATNRVNRIAKPRNEDKPLTSSEAWDRSILADYVGAGAILGSSAIWKYSKPVNIDHAKIEYKKLFAESGNPLVEKKPFTIGASADFVENKVTLGTANDESALLHELGHLKAGRQTNTANRFFKDAYNDFWNKSWAGENIPRKEISKRIGKFTVATLGRPFLNLPMEAEATGLAIKAAHEVHGIKRAAITAAKLTLPYASYVAGAVSTGYMGLAIYRAIVPPKSKSIVKQRVVKG